MKTVSLSTLLVSLSLLASSTLALPGHKDTKALLQPFRSGTPFHRRATTCNGDASLCSRSYANVTFAGSHNSYAVDRAGGNNAAANQNITVTTQLNAGLRMLQSQAHTGASNATGSQIQLCHTSCSLFNGGTLEQWLANITSWSNANPTEVLTLLIVNIDALPASRYAQAFESTGLASKVYNPTAAGVGSAGALTRSQWPTLGALVDAGTPIVVFLSSGADTSSVGYLLPEFSSMWETPYDQTSIPFSCNVDRIGDGLQSESLMYLANTYLSQPFLGGTIPNRASLDTTNSLETQMASAQACASQHGNVAPNFLLTDFSQEGDYGVLQAAAQLNGVSYTKPAATSSSGGSSGAVSAMTQVKGPGMAAVAALAATSLFAL